MQSKPSFKTALITGSSSGLGKALADFLETKNIKVIRTESQETDLADPAARKQLLVIISEEKPDLIVNNAGFGLYGPTLHLPMEKQLEMIEVNVDALVEISIHAAKEWSRANTKGTILNISSAAAFLPFPGFNVYTASKAFVLSFSRALDAELKKDGIRVLCACPGQIATNFRHKAARGHPQKSDRRTMPKEKAVKHLWKQLQTQKRVSIFDWRTKLLLAIARIIPETILDKYLFKSITSRTELSFSSRDT